MKHLAGRPVSLLSLLDVEFTVTVEKLLTESVLVLFQAQIIKLSSQRSSFYSFIWKNNKHK